MAEKRKNVAASVRRRLFNLSRETDRPLDLLLTRYALERLLYRLAQAGHGNRFALKGAMLMTSWMEDPFRPTRDIDLLGFGNPEADAMLALFGDVCRIELDDGVRFDAESLAVISNREDLAYGGLRLQTHARIDGAKVRIIIDIGFGDSTEPGLEQLDLPVLLDQPAPRLRTYARETVIAEKFQAIVMLGMINTRLKDYYDIWVLARGFEYDSERLARAIAATFQRRATPIPETLPQGLSANFAEILARQRQWAALLEDTAVDPGDLASVLEDLAAFLMPAARGARNFQARYSPAAIGGAGTGT
ncbi:MAG: nucleotidyl transferase AbiEii/AbiGii toxin family protein [Sphingomicrobium sp.]